MKKNCGNCDWWYELHKRHGVGEGRCNDKRWRKGKPVPASVVQDLTRAFEGEKCPCHVWKKESVNA